jgi:hypothetical protein
MNQSSPRRLCLEGCGLLEELDGKGATVSLPTVAL